LSDFFLKNFYSASASKFPLGLLPVSDDFEEDEESVAFFDNLDEELVGAPLTYDAVSLGEGIIDLCGFF
jgi:hypothetical protein